MRQIGKRTDKITVFCLGIISGLLLAKQTKTSLDVSWLVFSLTLIILSLSMRSRYVVFVCLFATSLIIGLWRGGVVYQKLQQYEPLREKEVQLLVTARTDGIYTDRSQTEFIAGDIQLEYPEAQFLNGQVTVSGFGASSIIRGDTVRVIGKMRDGFGNRQGFVRFAKLEVVSRSSSIVEKFRRDFQAVLYSSLPEPQGSFANGLILGQRSDLPEVYEDNLRSVGLTHIIAVSGYNLTILAEVIRSRLQKKSRYLSTVIAIGIVLSFVAIAGTSSSVNRASIVAIFSIGAAYFGRKFRPQVLIALPAYITAFTNPLALWFDLGWWLSFLAFFGILVVAPTIKQALRLKSERLFTQVAVESISASLMTLPLVLFIFEKMPLLALVANILVVPLVPFAMFGAVFVGVFAMFLPEIVGWVAWPVRYLLTYLLDVSTVLARIPNTVREIKISFWVMLALYAIILVLLLGLQKRSKPKYATITGMENY